MSEQAERRTVQVPKPYPPYTRSVLRSMLVHTSLNAHPIKGIGQTVCQDSTNNDWSTERTLGGNRPSPDMLLHMAFPIRLTFNISEHQQSQNDFSSEKREPQTDNST